jgi:hypothetical protein
MSQVFGTPIYIFNADDPSGKTKKDGTVSMTGRIEETLKALKPLDKARTAVQNAVTALDGTAYEEIKKALAGIVQSITATEQKVVSQISGTEAQVGIQPDTAAKTTSPQTGAQVPTLGQINGTEPLPA